jgi:hypothetical protein
MCNVTLRSVRATILAVEKAVNMYYIFSLCVGAVLASYYVVICCLSGSAYFSTLSRKWNDFLGKVLNIKYLMWFLYILQRLSQPFLILKSFL